MMLIFSFLVFPLQRFVLSLAVPTWLLLDPFLSRLWLAVSNRLQVAGIGNQNFMPDEADIILVIPSLEVDSPDILSWRFDRFGNYNVKWFARDCFKKPSCSDSTAISSVSTSPIRFVSSWGGRDIIGCPA
ncbi:hypothetical protein ACOSQ3_006874 [Xanthoceras sorbifolium]